MGDLFIGLMSGTSLDGVDGALVDFGDSGRRLAINVLAHVHRPFSTEFSRELLALNSPQSNELHRAAIAGNELAVLSSEVVHELLGTSGLSPSTITAIASHGQTVRHRPSEFDGIGYTLQLDSPALLAERTGIDVIADFRSRDLAAGGQGAPLVPAFHRAAFASPGETIVVLNIGGISNLSVLAKDGSTIGFDCGPGNVLMDNWCSTHRGVPYDLDGAWASSGLTDQSLLKVMQTEAYFALPPPKSTGRDLFNTAWLARCLTQAASVSQPTSTDVQASLAELTAWCCEQSALDSAPEATHVLVCGGGAYNGHLMRRLAARLTWVQVGSTAERGLPANQVEAVAFAWLAREWLQRRPGNLPTVTGAKGSRVLGALYPAG